MFFLLGAYLGTFPIRFLVIPKRLPRPFFVPALFDTAMIFAMIGGITSLAWYSMAARRLLQLAK